MSNLFHRRAIVALLAAALALAGCASTPAGFSRIPPPSSENSPRHATTAKPPLRPWFTSRAAAQ